MIHILIKILSSTKHADRVKSFRFCSTTEFVLNHILVQYSCSDERFMHTTKDNGAINKTHSVNSGSVRGQEKMKKHLLMLRGGH